MNKQLLRNDVILDDPRLLKLGLRALSVNAIDDTVGDRFVFDVKNALDILKEDPSLGARLLFLARSGDIYWAGDKASEKYDGKSLGVRIVRSSVKGDQAVGENYFGEFLDKVRSAYIDYLEENPVNERGVGKYQVIYDFTRKDAAESDITARERLGERFIHVDSFNPVKSRGNAGADGSTGSAERFSAEDSPWKTFECPFGTTPPAKVVVETRAEAAYLYERALRDEMDWEALFADLTNRGLMNVDLPKAQKEKMIRDLRSQFNWIREQICLDADLRDLKVVGASLVCDDASMGRSIYDADGAPSPAHILARYINNPVLLFSKPQYMVVSAMSPGAVMDEPDGFHVDGSQVPAEGLDILVFGSDTIGGRIPGQRMVQKTVRHVSVDEDGSENTTFEKRFEAPVKPKAEIEEDYAKFSKRMDSILSGIPEGTKVRLVTGGLSPYSSHVGLGTPRMLVRYVREKGGVVLNWDYENRTAKQISKAEPKNADISVLCMDNFYDAFPVLSKNAKTVSFLKNADDLDSEVKFRDVHGIRPAGAVCFSVNEDRNNALLLSAASYAGRKMPLIHVQENMSMEEQLSVLQTGRKLSYDLFQGESDSIRTENLFAEPKTIWDVPQCNNLSFYDKENDIAYPFVSERFPSPVNIDNVFFYSAQEVFIALAAKENGLATPDVLKTISAASGRFSVLQDLASKYAYGPGSVVSGEKEEYLLRRAVRLMVRSNVLFGERLTSLTDREIVMPVKRDDHGLFTDLDGRGENRFGRVLTAERKAMVEHLVILRQKAEDEQRSLIEAANRKKRAAIGTRVAYELVQDGLPQKGTGFADGVWFVGTNMPDAALLPQGKKSLEQWDDNGGSEKLVREIAGRPEIPDNNGVGQPNEYVFLFPTDLGSVTGRNLYINKRANSTNLTGLTRVGPDGKEFVCAWGVPVRFNNRGIEAVNADYMPCSYRLDNDAANFIDAIVLADASARTVAMRNGQTLCLAGHTTRDGGFAYNLGNIFMEKMFVNGKKVANPHASMLNLRSVDRYTDMLERGTYLPLNCITLPKEDYGKQKYVGYTTADDRQYTIESEFIADLKFSLKVAAATATMSGRKLYIPMKDGHIDLGPGVTPELAEKAEKVVFSFLGMVDNTKVTKGELPLIERMPVMKTSRYQSSLEKVGELSIKASDLVYAFGPYDYYYLASGQTAPRHEMAFMAEDGTVYTLKESRWADGMSAAQIKEYNTFCETHPKTRLSDCEELNYRLGLIEMMKDGKTEKANRFIIRSTDPDKDKLADFISALQAYCERAKSIKVETRLVPESEVIGKEESLNGFVNLLSSNSVEYAEDEHDVGRQMDFVNGKSRLNENGNEDIYYGHEDANDGFTGYTQMRYILPDGTKSGWETIRSKSDEVSELAIDVVMTSTDRKYRLDQRLVPSPDDMTPFLVARAMESARDAVRRMKVSEDESESVVYDKDTSVTEMPVPQPKVEPVPGTAESAGAVQAAGKEKDKLVEAKPEAKPAAAPKVDLDAESTVKQFRGDYYFLSNFYKTPVEYEGVTYPSAENAYQAAKCAREEDRKKFVDLSPAEAKRLGKQVELRPDWESVKVDVMRDVVSVKFDSNEVLRTKLIESDGMNLVEGNTWGDTYWGIDLASGEGSNHLGEILMEKRSSLVSQVESVSVAEESAREKENVPFLIVTESEGGYAQRTRENANAEDVDFTFAFALDFNTGGERCTAKAAGDSLIQTDLVLKEKGGLDTSAKAVKAAADNIVSRLPDGYVDGSYQIGVNVAGNGIFTLAPSGVTQEQCNEFVLKVFKELKKRGVSISSIRTGGQTGIDQAGALAGQALGVRTVVHAPNGFLYRDEKGLDHKGNRAAFVDRVTLKPKANAIRRSIK